MPSPAGQRIRKGDVIACLYTPPSSGDGCHIHFHLMIDGKKCFFAPAIFSREVVKGFRAQCQGLKESNDGTPIPPCMGPVSVLMKTRLVRGQKSSFE